MTEQLEARLRTAMPEDFDAFDKLANEAADTLMRYREALERIIAQDWWSAVDERDEIDGRCAEVARQALSDS